MKLFVISYLLALAAADVSHVVKGSDKDAQILQQILDVSPEGRYEWSFDTDNGISGGAQGDLINLDTENPSQVVQGSAKWKSPEGEEVVLTYIADENGYQPQGSHLPTPPPIPKQILRALEYIRAHPPAPEQK